MIHTGSPLSVERFIDNLPAIVQELSFRDYKNKMGDMVDNSAFKALVEMSLQIPKKLKKKTTSKQILS